LRNRPSLVKITRYLTRIRTGGKNIQNKQYNDNLNNEIIVAATPVVVVVIVLVVVVVIVVVGTEIA
jgi:type IV secretory pathway VirB6-like protein